MGTSPDKRDHLLTYSVRRADLAEAWGVSVRTLARLAAKGEGPPCYKVGTALLYDAREAEAWRLAQANGRAAVVAKPRRKAAAEQPEAM